MAKKVLLGAVSAVLLVAAVVGVVAVTVRSTHRAGDNFSAPGGDLVTSSKSITALCAPTLYRESCERTLSVAVNNTADPGQVIKAAVQLALDEVQAVAQKSGDIGKGSDDSLTKGAVEDCKKLLGDSLDELRAIVNLAGDFQGLLNRSDDVKHWLTASMTFLDNCVDGFHNPELKSAMDNALRNATQLSSNALAIITSLGSVVKGLDLSLVKSSTDSRRRLLAHEEEAYERDEQGYPTWLSAGDRKLLASRNNVGLRPNVVVAQDGSGDFKTINDAIKAIPKVYKGRYVIYVKAGVYQEYVVIPKDKGNVYMYGDGPKKTKVVGHKSYADGITTMLTATFAIDAPGFICKSMGFSNTAGAEKHQAVALRSQGEFSAFFNCRFDGYQDTLYSQAHRHFFRNCVISGPSTSSSATPRSSSRTASSSCGGPWTTSRTR
uniref:Pectinesterase inhibitor domain-containing protein n=1 Tax=Ananas comosus var. bracteatus TaxID=296719 RepID=A0A6V7P6Y0_ANACO|nr:unnamed protein product [Ananas comosus var. bracteatus]